MKKEAVNKLSDKQLIELIHSKGKIDNELKKDILGEIDKREILADKGEPINQTGLSWSQKLFYLLPIGFITFIFAAKYNGTGEIKKYNQAWRMIVIGNVIFYGIGIAYFGLMMNRT